MKKFLLLATAALLVTGVTFADNGKKKKKKCAKGQTCHTTAGAEKKSCGKDEAGVKKACCKDKKTAEVKM